MSNIVYLLVTKWGYSYKSERGSCVMLRLFVIKAPLFFFPFSLFSLSLLKSILFLVNSSQKKRKSLENGNNSETNLCPVNSPYSTPSHSRASTNNLLSLRTMPSQHYLHSCLRSDSHSRTHFCCRVGGRFTWCWAVVFGAC
ncbi:uncharacterized protein V2V93DRAFT_349049 [Kockiozyma suomiensis]|uniref:uncharacterized protein n=1 Tax=Kockiozyma suomiensis TaxID=1337062 RepID=UPI0033433258